MPSTVSSYPETHIWSAPSALQKLHSRAREAETACCAGVTFTKSLSCIEIPQCIYDSRDGLGLFSQDPIGFNAGDANLYRYVGNAPTMGTDPSGLEVVWYKPWTWAEPWFKQAIPSESDWQRLYSEHDQLVQGLNQRLGTSHKSIEDFPKDRLRSLGVPSSVVNSAKDPRREYRRLLGEAETTLQASEVSLEVADKATMIADIVTLNPRRLVTEGGEAIVKHGDEVAEMAVKNAGKGSAGRVVVQDTIETGGKNRVVVKDGILAPGEWRNGDLLLSRPGIREAAAETGNSVRRELYNTAYHEAFHGFVEKWTRPIAKWFGVDDFYLHSQDAYEWGKGWGIWFRTEEVLAEGYGRARGFLREYCGWK